MSAGIRSVRSNQLARTQPVAARAAAQASVSRRQQLFTRDEFVRSPVRNANVNQTQRPSGLSPAQTNALKKELSRVYERDFRTHLTGSFAYKTAVEHLQKKLIARGEKIEMDGLLGRGTYNAMVRQYGRRAADEISRHMMSMNRGGEEGG